MRIALVILICLLLSVILNGCAMTKPVRQEPDLAAMYADSLLLLVRNHKITEAEANRRWTEFVAQEYRRQAAAAAAAAASAHNPCNADLAEQLTSGDYFNCH
jgi:hypothetical protein